MSLLADLTWYGVSLIAIALLLLGVELKFGGYGVSGTLGAVVFALGAVLLVRGPHGIPPALAIAVSFALCLISVFLGYLGLRARRAKQLTGIERLVGEHGVTRTEVHAGGTVFVRGEYWQAESSTAIPAGRAISIEAVHGLLLYVREA